MFTNLQLAVILFVVFGLLSVVRGALLRRKAQTTAQTAKSVIRGGRYG